MARIFRVPWREGSAGDATDRRAVRDDRLRGLLG